MILNDLRGLGYRAVFGVVNAADYGVPQVRERVLFVGSRDGKDVSIPASTHSVAPPPTQKRGERRRANVALG